MKQAVISDLIDSCNKAKIIVMVGPPAAGKTTLAAGLKKAYPDAKFIATDDYMIHGFKESIYKIIEEINNSEFDKLFIEGVQTARLLRKGAELENFYCDLIIKFELPDDLLTKRYHERDGYAPVDSRPYPFSMLKALNTVWNYYVNAGNVNVPKIITITE